ncbi:MAG: hypothetical protein HYT10_01930 [Candidatus Levybacteria bacterium]|nr:hypothetical protein [Candidatus Levybacteria bacterium]
MSIPELPNPIIEAYFKEEYSKFKSPQGLPNNWFNTFLSANADFPQAAGVQEYIIGRQMFRSISEGEVSMEDAFNMGISEEQLRIGREVGNRHHQENGIGNISEEGILISWRRTSKMLSELKVKIGGWNLEDSDKLDIVMGLFDAANQALSLPESVQAKNNHRLFAITNPSDVCAQPALAPLYRNITTGVREKATEIEAARQIQIPEGVKNWFSFQPV